MVREDLARVALYTIGYEVAVTCSWPADDVTRLGYTSLDRLYRDFSRHRSVHLTPPCRSILGPRLYLATKGYDVVPLTPCDVPHED